MSNSFVFSSGSVTEGHPDKLCDQISDALVDGFLRDDRRARVVAECAVARGILFLSLNVCADTEADPAGIARAVLNRVGYTRGPFRAQDCSIMTSLQQDPSPEPATGEDTMDDGALATIVADHQVTVFGFACRQTPDLMPLPICLAHDLAKQLAEARRTGWSDLAPDGQTQVAVEYRGRRPIRIHSVAIVAATWEDACLDRRTLEEGIRSEVLAPVFARDHLGPDQHTTISVNPQGLFHNGGPERHAGLTGRKTAIDTYGEFARHSGSALSGKDPARIERVAAYGARFAAKNVVAAGLADECEVALSYTVGQAEPIGMSVSTFGTARLTEEEISRRLGRFVDFRPGPMLRLFGLRNLPSEANGPFYERLAAYGHMGRNDMSLPWERTVDAARLRE